jgi:transposase
MGNMKRFVQGDNRTQSSLLPEALDDHVTDTNPVRVVDVFVDELDPHKLGFEGVEPALTGRPSYHPDLMLNIYIYGYRCSAGERLIW